MPGARPMRGCRISRIGTSRTSSRGSSLAQLRQSVRLGVTIQKKVTRSEARALQDRLSREFERFPIKRSGLLLWRYLGGPWEQAGAFPFTAVPLHQTCPPGISAGAINVNG